MLEKHSYKAVMPLMTVFNMSLADLSRLSNLVDKCLADNLTAPAQLDIKIVLSHRIFYCLRQAHLDWLFNDVLIMTQNCIGALDHHIQHHRQLILKHKVENDNKEQ